MAISSKEPGTLDTLCPLRPEPREFPSRFFKVSEMRTHPLSIHGPILDETSMIWLMVIIAWTKKRVVPHVTWNHLHVLSTCCFNPDTVADRPRSASVHSSLHMPWHNWRTRALLGLFILAFQFWPSTTETPLATTSPVTGWSLNRTVALRLVLRSTSYVMSDRRCLLARGYGVCGITVLITTWTMVSPATHHQ